MNEGREEIRIYEDKIYNSREMQKQNICTTDYEFNYEEGTFEGILQLKAQSFNGPLRLFFQFVDGRKIIVLTWWYDRYAGMKDVPVGSRMNLTFVKKAKGVFLAKGEILGKTGEI